MEAAPIIALTQGDPAGIGPEIIVKAFQDEALPIDSKILVIGDALLLKRKPNKSLPKFGCIRLRHLKKVRINLAR